MYQEMSEETDKFFTFMLNHDLFDLDSKPGKQGGGIVPTLPKYEFPLSLQF